METGSIVAASLGGLGLFLLGSWLAGAGLGHWLATPLRERGARWSESARGAFLTGLGATVALGWSGSFALSVPALARRWQLPPARRALIFAGAASALALLPLLMWIDSLGWLVRAVAFVAIGAGALVRIVRPRHAVLGEGLAGHGLALLALGIVTAGLAELGAGLNLPAARGAPVTALVYVLAGAGLGFALRSPAAALVVAVQAGASGLTDLFGAASLLVGAGASLGLVTLELGRLGDADDGAGAAGQAFLGAAFLLSTGLLLFGSLSAPLLLIGLPGGTYGALAILTLFGLTVASLTFVVLSEPILNVVRHRLNATRPPTRAPYTPGPLEQAVPALLVEGIGASLDTVMSDTRKLAQARLQGGRLSRARMDEARGQAAEITTRLVEVAGELACVRWTGPDLAQALGAVRAAEACERLIEQLGNFPERSVSQVNEAGLQRQASLASARVWNLVEAATRVEELPLMDDFRSLRDMLDHELTELSVQVHSSVVAPGTTDPGHMGGAAVPAGWPAPVEAAAELVTHLRWMVHTTCELAEARALELAFEGSGVEFEDAEETLEFEQADEPAPGAPLASTSIVRRPVRIRGAGG